MPPLEIIPRSTRTTNPPLPRRDRLFGILVALCTLDFALLAPRLIYPDLNLDYPFVDGDSWDWIANGLRLAGHAVRGSGRPPLLPFAIALLDRLGALPWLPVLLQVLFLGTVLAFYGLAARLTTRPAAFAVALALLFDHSLRAMSLQVMADVPASCLLFLSARAFLRAARAGAEDRPRSYLASGLFAGAGALAQPAAFLLAPAAVAALALHRRRDLRSPWLAAGALALAAALVLAAAMPRAAGGGDVAAGHWDLVHLHAGAVSFYLWSLAALLGLPACALLGAGAVAALYVARNGAGFFILALTGSLLAFFVFFYDYNAERFLVYAVWPAGLLIAIALARLPRGAPFAIAAGLLVAGAALPLPSLGNDASWIGLSPVQPVYAHTSFKASPAGSPRLAGGITVERFPAASLLGFSIPARVTGARAAFAAAASPEAPGRLDPSRLAGDRGALYLYARESDGGGRYRTLTRLGNALRQRVKCVPAEWLAPHLREIGVETVGEIAPDYAVYRCRLPGLTGTWLLVTPEDGPARQALAAAVGRAPAEADPRWQEGLARAAALVRFVRGSDGYVALIPDRNGRDAASLYLPFLLDTTELYVVAPGEEAAVRALAAAAPGTGNKTAESPVAGARVRRFRHLGRRASLIEL